MEKFGYRTNDEVMVVDLSDPSVLNADDMRKGDLRVGDNGRVIEFRERTIRVNIKRSGITRNFLPERLVHVIGRQDYQFVWVKK